MVFTGLLHSQSLVNRVVATGGSFSASSSFRISYTIGDVLVKELQSSGFILSTGFQQYWDISVGIDDLPDEIRITAYPNPVSENLYIRFGDQSYPDILFQVMSLTGIELIRREYSGSLATHNFEINTSELPPGIYLLRVSDSNRLLKTVKLVKE